MISGNTDEEERERSIDHHQAEYKHWNNERTEMKERRMHKSVERLYARKSPMRE